MRGEKIGYACIDEIMADGVLNGCTLGTQELVKSHNNDEEEMMMN